jgi:ribosomal protein S6
MPAAEANSYELAFHVLPTVAEGEVATVFQNLKDVITNAGGTLGAEEAPARFDLAYEIERYLEGRNRKFSSAYFGWVRFTVDPAQIETIEEQVRATKELLRYMIVKLNKAEAEHPFFFHEALAEQKVANIEIEEEVAAEAGADVASSDETEQAEEESEAQTAEDGEAPADKV